LSEQHYLKDAFFARIKNDNTMLEFVQTLAPAGMWFWDLEHPEHVWIAPSLWKTLGYDPAEMPHHAEALQNIANPDDTQVAAENIQAHLADPSHPYNQVIRYYHQDGSTVWLRCRGMAVRDGNGKPVYMLGVHTDVTARKNAEERQRKNTEAYLNILDNHKAYIIRTDAEGNYTYANDLFLARFNLERHTILGTSSMDSIYVEDHPQALAAAQACLDNPHQPVNVALRKLMPDSRFKTTDWEFTGLTDDAGNTSEILCIGVDVTEQLAAKADLMRTVTLLEEAGRIANIGAWELNVVNDTFILTDQTYAIAELPIGIPIDKFEGIGFYHPDDQPLINRAVERAITQHEPFDVEGRFVTAKGKGKRLWVRVSGQPVVENGQVVRLIGMFQDITEQKEAELALRKSEAKFRSLVENANDVIVMLNPQGEYLYISPKGKEMTGVSTDGFIGQSFEVAVHPEDIDKVHQALVMIVRSKQAYEGIVYRALHGDGNWHWYSSNGAPLFDDAGNVSAIMTIIRDITSDKHAEQAMQATLKRLEQSVSQNAVLLKEIHHRVKNNLAVISALLSLRARDLNDPVAKSALQESCDRIKVMAEVHELMYQHDSHERIAFGGYLSGLIDRMQHAFGYGQQQITFAVEVTQCDIGLDQAVPLGLIINELLTNAVKHAFANDHPDPRVTVTATTDNGLTITVTDNGVGVDDTTTLETSNSLGMTVINSLTEQLEGNVTFVNHPSSDVGLQVTLHVPLA
jgi:PAS domain S-box-containing protein